MSQSPVRNPSLQKSRPSFAVYMPMNYWAASVYLLAQVRTQQQIRERLIAEAASEYLHAVAASN